MPQLKLLTIAGSDTSGGAGIQADLKVFHALGAYGLSAITALSAQNTQGVLSTHPIPSDFVTQQIKAITSDIQLDAIKIGMLHDATIVDAVFAQIASYHCRTIVLDPVIRASSGYPLITHLGLDRLLQQLHHCQVITPNSEELAHLTAPLTSKKTSVAKARFLALQSNVTVVVTGGHTKSNRILIMTPQGDAQYLAFKRITSRHTHGTGCVFAAALTSYLAMRHDLVAACRLASDFTTKAVFHGRRQPISTAGVSPVQPQYART